MAPPKESISWQDARSAAEEKSWELRAISLGGSARDYSLTSPDGLYVRFNRRHYGLMVVALSADREAHALDVRELGLKIPSPGLTPLPEVVRAIVERVTYDLVRDKLIASLDAQVEGSRQHLVRLELERRRFLSRFPAPAETPAP